MANTIFWVLAAVIVVAVIIYIVVNRKGSKNEMSGTQQTPTEPTDNSGEPEV